MPDQNENVVRFPNLVQLCLRRVALALQEDDLEEAISLLNEIIELDPTRSEEKQLRDSLVEQLSEIKESERSLKVEIEPQDLVRWKDGLLQTDFQKQWQSFEQMHSFMNEKVIELVQQFLIYPKGDPTLKTKILQQCKLTCPGSWLLEIEKGDQKTTLKLADVPVEMGEWDSIWIKPFQTLQIYASQDPTLVEMAKEVWMYFLEKLFPFIPSVQEAYKWTAALHYYTLKMLHKEYAQQKLASIATQYSLTTEELIEHERVFQAKLLLVP